ncbi:MAG: DegT/DnrJ/EryC1/StrS family aminotransferase, partial [Candidatus Liptonbacteria bacterium]|nr:DegT/DnrJ/EryC1/StrS family aminotransferase [Candidatus Liptonbacteria bacterium]
RRQEIAETYRKGLSGIVGLKLPHFPATGYTDVFQNYVIQTPRRDELKNHLEQSSVETMISWPKPIYTYPTLAPTLDPPAGGLPETEKTCREVISIPLYPELENNEIQYVIDTITAFFAKAS